MITKLIDYFYLNHWTRKVCWTFYDKVNVYLNYRYICIFVSYFNMQSWSWSWSCHCWFWLQDWFVAWNAWSQNVPLDEVTTCTLRRPTGSGFIHLARGVSRTCRKTDRARLSAKSWKKPTATDLFVLFLAVNIKHQLHEDHRPKSVTRCFSIKNTVLWSK